MVKRIVINNCINFLKKKNIDFETLQENIIQIPNVTVPTEETTTYNVQAIQNALFKLPDGYRVVFSLYAMEGYTHKEIASILNISEATSKSQYSRAKKKIKTLVIAQHNNNASS